MCQCVLYVPCSRAQCRCKDESEYDSGKRYGYGSDILYDAPYPSGLLCRAKQADTDDAYQCHGDIGLGREEHERCSSGHESVPCGIYAQGGSRDCGNEYDHLQKNAYYILFSCKYIHYLFLPKTLKTIDRLIYVS